MCDVTIRECGVVGGDFFWRGNIHQSRTYHPLDAENTIRFKRAITCSWRHVSIAGILQLASSVSYAAHIRSGQRFVDVDPVMSIPALLTDMVYLTWICEMMYQKLILLIAVYY